MAFKYSNKMLALQRKTNWSTRNFQSFLHPKILMRETGNQNTISKPITLVYSKLLFHKCCVCYVVTLQIHSEEESFVFSQRKKQFCSRFFVKIALPTTKTVNITFQRHNENTYVVIYYGCLMKLFSQLSKVSRCMYLHLMAHNQKLIIIFQQIQ